MDPVTIFLVASALATGLHAAYGGWATRPFDWDGIPKRSRHGG